MIEDSDVEVALTNWGSRQPDNHEGVQHCAVVNANKEWDDQKCNKTYQYVCYKESK